MADCSPAPAFSCGPAYASAEYRSCHSGRAYLPVSPYTRLICLNPSFFEIICPGRCLFCPGKIPKSPTLSLPVLVRAIRWACNSSGPVRIRKDCHTFAASFPQPPVMRHCRILFKLRCAVRAPCSVDRDLALAIRAHLGCGSCGSLVGLL